ncbi:hypothetical protein MPSI1_001658 [Malassezia psittaci]|uniref:Enoyl reductase (ER) domain-containing protein n=1 Tax=Malassezia psittaci TaxID=1821823 RepID=A0AAF0F957_9BASI|nr:hypothetical protein MPSI1_001658 [Malassezia psittaci]
MPKTTFLDSILGRPSQNYSSSDSPSRGKAKERFASESGAPKSSPSRSSAFNQFWTSPQKKSPSRSRTYSDKKSRAFSESGSVRSRLGTKRNKEPIPDSPIGSSPTVPIASSPSTFSSWWDDQSKSKSGTASNTAASEPGESFAERWRRDMSLNRPARSEMGESASMVRSASRNKRSASRNSIHRLSNENPTLVLPPHLRSLQKDTEKDTANSGSIPSVSPSLPSSQSKVAMPWSSPTTAKTRESGQWYEFVRTMEQREASRRAQQQADPSLNTNVASPTVDDAGEHTSSTPRLPSAQPTSDRSVSKAGTPASLSQAETRFGKEPEQRNDPDVSQIGVALSRADTSHVSMSEPAPALEADLPYFHVFPPVANAGSQKLTAVTEEEDERTFSRSVGLGIHDDSQQTTTDVSVTALSPPSPPMISDSRPAESRKITTPSHYQMPTTKLAPPFLSPSMSSAQNAAGPLLAGRAQLPSEATQKQEAQDASPSSSYSEHGSSTAISQPSTASFQHQSGKRAEDLTTTPQPAQSTQLPTDNKSSADSSSSRTVAPSSEKGPPTPAKSKRGMLHQKSYPVPQHDRDVFESSTSAPTTMNATSLEDVMLSEDLARLSWSPALYYAQEEANPNVSVSTTATNTRSENSEATKALAPSPLVHDSEHVPSSNFVSALDQHQDAKPVGQPAGDAATAAAAAAVSSTSNTSTLGPALGSTLGSMAHSSTSNRSAEAGARLPSVAKGGEAPHGFKQPSSYAPQRAEAITSRGLSHGTSRGLSSQYKSPLNNWPNEDASLNVPSQSPNFSQPTAPRWSAGRTASNGFPRSTPSTSATRIASARSESARSNDYGSRSSGQVAPHRNAQRWSAMSIADSDILDLDPTNAPWTMTSEVGHYDRSELHGTADDDSSQPSTPGGTPKARLTHATPQTPYAFQHTTNSITPGTTPGRKVLDRPRNRGPRPTEMGGVPIAHGTLPAVHPTPRSSRSVSETVRPRERIPPVPKIRHVSADEATSKPSNRAWTDDDDTTIRFAPTRSASVASDSRPKPNDSERAYDTISLASTPADDVFYDAGPSSQQDSQDALQDPPRSTDSHQTQDPLTFTFEDLPDLRASVSLADTLVAFQKRQSVSENEANVSRAASQPTPVRYRVTPAQPAPIWQPELADKAAKARENIVPTPNASNEAAQEEPRLAYLQKTPTRTPKQTMQESFAPSGPGARQQEPTLAQNQLSASVPGVSPIKAMQDKITGEKALPSTPDRMAAMPAAQSSAARRDLAQDGSRAAKPIMLEINGQMLEYEPSDAGSLPSAQATPYISAETMRNAAPRSPSEFQRNANAPGATPPHPSAYSANTNGISPMYNTGVRPSGNYPASPASIPMPSSPQPEAGARMAYATPRAPYVARPAPNASIPPNRPYPMPTLAPGAQAGYSAYRPDYAAYANQGQSPHSIQTPYFPPQVRAPPRPGVAPNLPQGYGASIEMRPGPYAYAPPIARPSQRPSNVYNGMYPVPPHGMQPNGMQPNAQRSPTYGTQGYPTPMSPHTAPVSMHANAMHNVSPVPVPAPYMDGAPDMPQDYNAYASQAARPRHRAEYPSSMYGDRATSPVSNVSGMPPSMPMGMRMARPMMRPAPPRAQLVQPPSERTESHQASRPTSPIQGIPTMGMGGMRRISSTPDVTLGRQFGTSTNAGHTESGEYVTPPVSIAGQSNWGGETRAPSLRAPTISESRTRASPDYETQSALTALRQHAGSPPDTREPSLTASTSVLNPITASVMKKAPLGASTNRVLGLAADDESIKSPPSMTSSVSRTRISTKDLLRSRPTMITVNVTSGTSPVSAKTLRRKQSTSTDGGRRWRDNDSTHQPEHPAQLTVALSSHVAPPRKISPTQILVQIIAVAIDNIDRALLRERAQSDPGQPWVPGRSFCGRVIESGWDVKKIRKGDTVFGLQDYRKCGALAEFMSIDQDLCALAPEGRLTAEQIAALPCTGIMVHQIVQNHCMVLPRGARILILNAHDGIGLLALQEASRLGLIIIAHVPAHAADGVSICEANGATEVVTGEALWAINLLHESSFNLIVDTIGGRAIYDACRRILAHQGQFVTCFGDDRALPTPTYRSHLRSLRRSFFRKDRKGIGYEWIGIDAGPDCRIALESIKVAAQRGAICPRIQSVLPIEDAARALDQDLGSDKDSGLVVIRIS